MEKIASITDQTTAEDVENLAFVHQLPCDFVEKIEDTITRDAALCGDEQWSIYSDRKTLVLYHAESVSGMVNEISTGTGNSQYFEDMSPAEAAKAYQSGALS